MPKKGKKKKKKTMQRENAIQAASVSISIVL